MATLTPKQSAFVAEYLIDLNATQAAIRAGYSERTAKVQGARLLTNADITAAVAEAKQERAKRVEITADYVLGTLTEVVQRCMQRAPVMTRQGREMVQAKDDAGNHVWQFDAKGANSALNLLGQHLGLYTKKLEHSGEVKGGGVLVVPATPTVTTWTTAAQQQQTELDESKRALAAQYGVG